MITIPEKRKKTLTIIIAVLALLGILLNLAEVFASPLSTRTLLEEREHAQESYEENIVWADEKNDDVWLVYAARDKATVTEINGLIPFAVLCVAVFLCAIFCHRFLPLFLVIPAADLVRLIIAYFTEGTSRNYHKHLLLAMAAFLILIVLIIVSICSKKSLPAIFAVIVSVGCAVLLLASSNLSTLIYGNQFGNALLLLLVLIFAKPPKLKKAVLAPACAAPAFFTPKSGNFCAACGSPLTGTRFCGKCGTPISVTPQSRVSTSAVPMQGNLLSHNGFFVDEKVTAFETEKAFSVYDENGTVLGYVKEGISAGAKAARAALGRGIGNLQSIEYTVTDALGTPVFTISKKGISPAEIFDSNGNFLAKLATGNLVNAAGQKIAAVKMGFGMERKLTVLDPAGNLLGFVSKKWNGIVRTVFTSADKYYISMTPGTNDYQRILVFAAALIYEMILGNR